MIVYSFLKREMNMDDSRTVIRKKMIYTGDRSEFKSKTRDELLDMIMRLQLRIVELGGSVIDIKKEEEKRARLSNGHNKMLNKSILKSE